MSELSALERDALNAVLSGLDAYRRRFGENGNFTLSAKDLRGIARSGIAGSTSAFDSPASARRIAMALRMRGYVRPVEHDRYGLPVLWTVA